MPGAAAPSGRHCRRRTPAGPPARWPCLPAGTHSAGRSHSRATSRSPVRDPAPPPSTWPGRWAGPRRRPAHPRRPDGDRRFSHHRRRGDPSVKSRVSLTRIEASDNRTVAGGGFLRASAGTVTVTDSIFADNRADRGGALAVSNAALVVTGSTFTGNDGSADGGAIWADHPAGFKIIGSTFNDNATLGQGGAIYLNGIAAGSDAPMLVESTTFATTPPVARVVPSSSAPPATGSTQPHPRGRQLHLRVEHRPGGWWHRHRLRPGPWCPAPPSPPTGPSAVAAGPSAPAARSLRRARSSPATRPPNRAGPSLPTARHRSVRPTFTGNTSESLRRCPGTGGRRHPHGHQLLVHRQRRRHRCRCHLETRHRPEPVGPDLLRQPARRRPGPGRPDVRRHHPADRDDHHGPWHADHHRSGRHHPAHLGIERHRYRRRERPAGRQARPRRRRRAPSPEPAPPSASSWPPASAPLPSASWSAAPPTPVGTVHISRLTPTGSSTRRAPPHCLRAKPDGAPRRTIGRVTVYLVGAGPGDPGLLTVRGAEVLRPRPTWWSTTGCRPPSLLDLAPPRRRADQRRQGARAATRMAQERDQRPAGRAGPGRPDGRAAQGRRPVRVRPRRRGGRGAGRRRASPSRSCPASPRPSPCPPTPASR